MSAPPEMALRLPDVSGSWTGSCLRKDCFFDQVLLSSITSKICAAVLLSPYLSHAYAYAAKGSLSEQMLCSHSLLGGTLLLVFENVLSWPYKGFSQRRNFMKPGLPVKILFEYC
jgi:hypothetical protein